MRYVRVGGCSLATFLGFYWFFTSQNIFECCAAVMLGSTALASLVVACNAPECASSKEESAVDNGGVSNPRAPKRGVAIKSRSAFACAVSYLGLIATIAVAFSIGYFTGPLGEKTAAQPPQGHGIHP